MSANHLRLIRSKVDFKPLSTPSLKTPINLAVLLTRISMKRSSESNANGSRAFSSSQQHPVPPPCPLQSPEPRFKNSGIGIESVGPKPIRPGDPDPGSAEPGRARLS
ncbi:hypothetical protein Taro_000253 [Colocasia esculenta]|uniref:Uncharacterized protein n=1 Tax=Colocasia esculenta TaxID=4460 RepID=A0A843TGZ0_COLES|nr:hypothetical protein [Colocasia esculenta]